MIYCIAEVTVHCLVQSFIGHLSRHWSWVSDCSRFIRGTSHSEFVEPLPCSTVRSWQLGFTSFGFSTVTIAFGYSKNCLRGLALYIFA